MKKLTFWKSLFLLCALIVGSVNGWADDVLTLDCATPAPTGSTSTALSSTSDVATFLNSAAGLSTAENKITCSAKSGDVYKGKGSGGGNIPQECLKVGKASGGGSFTFTIPDTYDEIDEVEITCYGWKTTSSISINSGTAQTFTTAQVETTKTFELSGSTRTIAISVTSSAVCITEIVLKKKATSSVEKPQFSPAGGTYTSTQSVTLSCETTGADIYYTLDGTTPTASSTKYNNTAISISETKTIKAIAIKGSDESNVATATYTIYPVLHAGTEADPYTVADARNALTAGIIGAETEYYVKGYISQIGTLSNEGQLTYWLSDDGSMTNNIQCYKGKYIDGAAFEATTDIEEGDFATVKGKLKIYNTIYEFDANNEIVSISSRTKVNISTFTATTLTIVIGESTETTVTNDQAGWTPVSYTYESDDTDIATVDANGVVTAVAKGTANITVTANVAADDANYKAGESKSVEITVTNPFHNVIFSVNGIAGAPTPTEEGDDIVFPAAPASIGGKEFKGWAAAAINGNQSTAPTYVTSAKMGTSDVTYYAVFAKASGTGGTAWVETAIDDISSSDEIVISNGSLAMSNNNGTGSAPAAVSITVSSSKITSNVEDNLIWNVSGNATDGYTFYPNGSTTTWLYCNTNAASSSNNNIRVGTGDRKVWEFDDDGYLVTKDTYTDRYLSIYDNSNFRSYVNTTNGAFVPVFYKQTELTTYSEYCTNVTVPVSITSAGYASYVTPSHINFEGTGVTAYKVSAASSTGITMDPITAAPESTPVILKATEGDYNLKAVADKPADVDENILLAGPVTGDGASYYVLGKDASNKLGFGLLKAGVELPATKAYFLASSVSGARVAFIPFDSETTAIDFVIAEPIDANAPMYNLAGQRVNKSYKGVVIVNGKKMLNK